MLYIEGQQTLTTTAPVDSTPNFVEGTARPLLLDLCWSSPLRQTCLFDAAHVHCMRSVTSIMGETCALIVRIE